MEIKTEVGKGWEERSEEWEWGGGEDCRPRWEDRSEGTEDERRKKEGRRMWNEEITVTYHTIDKLDMSSLHITTQKSNDRKDSLFISASYWIYF